jgi:hypothetical protein
VLKENRLLQKEHAHKQPAESRLSGAVRGVLGGLSAQGEPLVDFCGNPTGQPLAAVATVAVQPRDIGKEVILLFEDGDPNRPLLVGLVQSPYTWLDNSRNILHVTLDGERLTLSAEQEICLRCGDASITLTRAGKVLIKGAYLLSKSTGPNRIKGGSIQLN